MNGSTETTKTDELSWSQTVGGLARHYLGGRRGLMLLTGVVVVAGLALNWGWLVAVGVAPLLLALAPCAAMCALGLCMSKMGGKSCSSGSNPQDQGTKAKNASATTAANTGNQG